MAFDVIQPEKAGFLGLEADLLIPKSQRGMALSTGVRVEAQADRFMNNYVASQPVEPMNVTFWKARTAVTPIGQPMPGHILPRGAWGGWSGAVPARHMGGGEYFPLLDVGAVDHDFQKERIKLAGGGANPPIGADVIVMSTTKHGAHEKIAFFGGSNAPIISHHRGGNPPVFSTLIHDINQNNALDQIRKAGFHTFTQVREWVPPCSVTSSGITEFTVAIVGNASPDGTGYQHVTYGNVDALHSFLASGPLRYSTPKHTVSVTGDGPIRSGAIDLNALYCDGTTGTASNGALIHYDAPLDFHKEIYPEVMNSIHPYEVHLHYDDTKKHPNICGPRDGLWRWFVRIPICETPPCNPTKEDPGAYDAGLDTTGNPRRLFPADQRVFSSKKTQTPGIYFQSRPGINQGKPEVTKYLQKV